MSYSGSRWRDTLELARVRSGFGGSRAFWLCPICGKRARFLYFKDRRFVCRECAKLNYRSQQRTRDSINHYLDGKKLVDVVQAALDNNMTVDDVKALLILENPGHEVTFKVQ